jgi:hypothetical protein
VKFINFLKIRPIAWQCSLLGPELRNTAFLKEEKSGI